MISIIKDNAELFGIREELYNGDEKKIFRLISKALLHNPKDIILLLGKYEVIGDDSVPTEIQEITPILVEKLNQGDKAFNYEFAEILTRYSQVGADVIAAISKAIGDIFGFGESLVDKSSQADAINAQVTADILRAKDAKKRRAAQITMIVVAFVSVVIIIITISIFKPFAKKQ